MYVEITSQEQFTKLTTAEATDKLVSIYFHTSWAEPCSAMTPVFKAASVDHTNKDVIFLSIDAENYSEIAELFDVSSVPYFVFIKNGTILKELASATPKDYVKILNSLNVTSSTSQLQEQNTASGSSAPTKKNNTATENNYDVGTNDREQGEDEDEEEEEEESEEQLNERLKQLTHAAPVMLFMKGTPNEPKCGFSRQMVGILREHQIKFGFFDILKDDGVRQGLKKFSDWPTYPQLYIKGELQGGLDIIKESIEEDADFFQHALEA
ncbi:monothiol glutaredoxin GRX4 SCDLUD_001676 [Saccharomycodes ludwigii]|uniref:monothiol glutaredoxin GRX4 n=1 Tax=Saccharomycodes ludwigii TaxID=36035 RepID=UPI001E8AC6B3|nr:hypothetical protein SCDLUD_001676 [Saccharomycodes ludwigii]KAH3901892.1 hypothetical protein SCDLUD_001676 [Saccharomycodes ludwigii]